MIPRLDIPAAMLAAMTEQAEAEYPNECCGMIMASKDGEALTRVRPCKNAQDKYHAVDPEAFPRQAKTAYFIEPIELLRIDKELSANEERIAAIYHSHPDVGAYFSEEDIRQAAPDGEPMYPGAAYVVLSVAQGKVDNHKIFYWDAESATYVE